MSNDSMAIVGGYLSILAIFIGIWWWAGGTRSKKDR